MDNLQAVSDDIGTMRLAIVEDDTLQCIDLEESLEEMGFKVVAVAQHLAGAHRLIERHGSDIDAVLLDLSLSGKSARPLVDEMDRRGIRYMAVTGMRMNDVRSHGLDCPIMEKPFSPEILRAHLAKLRQAAT